MAIRIPLTTSLVEEFMLDFRLGYNYRQFSTNLIHVVDD